MIKLLKKWLGIKSPSPIEPIAIDRTRLDHKKIEASVSYELLSQLPPKIAKRMIKQEIIGYVAEAIESYIVVEDEPFSRRKVATVDIWLKNRGE